MFCSSVFCLVRVPVRIVLLVVVQISRFTPSMTSLWWVGHGLFLPPRDFPVAISSNLKCVLTVRRSWTTSITVRKRTNLISTACKVNQEVSWMISRLIRSVACQESYIEVRTPSGKRKKSLDTWSWIFREGVHLPLWYELVVSGLGLFQHKLYCRLLLKFCLNGVVSLVDFVQHGIRPRGVSYQEDSRINAIPILRDDEINVPPKRQLVSSAWSAARYHALPFSFRFQAITEDVF